MKKEKFKIGTPIYFMQSNKVEKGEVSAIIEVEGRVKFDYTQFDTAPNQKEVVYYVEYSQIKEVDAFDSLDELKNSLFSGFNPKQV